MKCRTSSKRAHLYFVVVIAAAAVDMCCCTMAPWQWWSFILLFQCVWERSEKIREHLFVLTCPEHTQWGMFDTSHRFSGELRSSWHYFPPVRSSKEPVSGSSICQIKLCAHQTIHRWGASHHCASKGFYSCSVRPAWSFPTCGLQLGHNLIAPLTLRLRSDGGSVCIRPSCYCVIPLWPDNYDDFDWYVYCPTKASSHKTGDGKDLGVLIESIKWH